jgi:AcrR family transcriptional regulator
MTPAIDLANQAAPLDAPKPRMSADERRSHLIGVALHLFATKGFRGTTTREIAQAAGVSEGVIFRHFPTKEALYVAILDERRRGQGMDRPLDELGRQVRAGDDDAVVSHLVARLLGSFERDPDFQRLMLLTALERNDLAEVSQRILGLPLFDLLREYVVRRQQSGTFRPGDPDLLVYGLVALPLHFAMVSKLFGLERVQRSDREVVDTFTRLILDGIRSAPVRRSPPRGVRTARPGSTGAGRTR